MPIAELKQKAKEAGIQGYNKMSKEDLIKELTDINSENKEENDE